jgi:hypothetical protein
MTDTIEASGTSSVWHVLGALGPMMTNVGFMFMWANPTYGFTAAVVGALATWTSTIALDSENPNSGWADYALATIGMLSMVGGAGVAHGSITADPVFGEYASIFQKAWVQDSINSSSTAESAISEFPDGAPHSFGPRIHKMESDHPGSYIIRSIEPFDAEVGGVPTDGHVATFREINFINVEFGFDVQVSMEHRMLVTNVSGVETNIAIDGYENPPAWFTDYEFAAIWDKGAPAPSDLILSSAAISSHLSKIENSASASDMIISTFERGVTEGDPYAVVDLGSTYFGIDRTDLRTHFGAEYISRWIVKNPGILTGEELSKVERDADETGFYQVLDHARRVMSDRSAEYERELNDDIDDGFTALANRIK